MELDLFIGRFHPLVVHLPIGFLLLAIIMEYFAIKYPEQYKLNQAVKIALIVGFLGSLITIITGLMLSNKGGYNIDTLGLHKWMGISILVISLIAYLIKHYSVNYSMMKSVAFSVFFFILISFTGHYGGILTHGETYLFEYAPGFIQNLAGVNQKENIDLTSMHPDSINVYTHIIQPTLNTKCASCHNENKIEGDLILTSYEDFIIGGEDGSILNMQHPFESTLLTRVTLPHDSKKFMPPNGTPLSFNEIKILEWWMRAGADSTLKFSDAKLDEELITAINRDYKLDYTEKPYYEKVRVDSVSSVLVAELKESGFSVSSLGESNNMISLKYKADTLTKEAINKLTQVSEQVTWLNLSNCLLADEMLSTVSKLPNLTRLDLHTNQITDSGIKNLATLKHVESLNLYNTNLSDSGLREIAKMEGLKRVYVWQTSVTAEGIEQALTLKPDLTIERGIN